MSEQSPLGTVSIGGDAVALATTSIGGDAQALGGGRLRPDGPYYQQWDILNSGIYPMSVPVNEFTIQWKYSLNNDTVSGCIVGKEAVFITDSTSVESIDFDGNRNWSNSLDYDLHNCVCVTEDSVIAHDYQGRLYRLDKETGDRIWDVGHNQHIAYTEAPMYHDGVIYTVADQWVKASDHSDGSIIWESEYTNNNADGITQPVYHDGKIYAIQSDVLIVDASDGTILYDRELSGDVVAGPCVHPDSDSMVNGVTNGEVYRQQLSDGAHIWGKDFGSGITGIVVYDGDVFIQEDNGAVYRAALSDGSTIWKTQLNSSNNYSPLKIIGGVLYTEDNEGYFYSIDPDDGSIIHSEELKTNFAESHFDAREGVIYLKDDNYLLAVE